jgi:glycosyltransferase involved in cell wall biosynthesis
VGQAKVALVHIRLGWGGSEAVALWALQALRPHYDVSLITCGPVDLPRLNEYYGTALNSGDFTLLRILPPGLKAGRFDALQAHILQRYCQRVASRFDVMISSYNPLNFGVPGIHFVSDFSFVPEWRFALYPTLRNHKRWWYGDSPLRRAYLGLCNLISSIDLHGFKQDVLVANSKWSAARVRERMGVEARTLYPPVVGEFPSVPEKEMENGFVCLGRVVPEKRVDQVVEILAQVRRRGHDIHLHVLGGFEDGRYERQLKGMTSAHRDWVFFEGKTLGAKKKELLARHRFGIHGCKNEAFGIAVAEMVKAGCLTFVPNGGGQTEIVDHPSLTFENDDDAIQKIVSVLQNRALQAALAEHLRERSRELSTERFQDTVRSLVAEFLATRGGQGALARKPSEVGVKE